MNGEVRDRWCGVWKRVGDGDGTYLHCDYGPDDHADMHWDLRHNIEWRHRSPLHQSQIGTVHENQTTLEDQIREATP